jgi:hypothetical protein
MYVVVGGSTAQLSWAALPERAPSVQVRVCETQVLPWGTVAVV